MFAKKGGTTSEGKRNKQGLLLVRTGVPSLDDVLEGGLPQGCLCLLEEDSVLHHWLQITRCFLGEGVLSKQKTILYSEREEGREVIPAVKIGGKVPEQTDQLRIAFRYENFPPLSAIQAPYSFETSKCMDQKLLDQSPPFIRRIQTSSEDCFRTLWSDILSDLQSTHSSKDHQGLKRLVIKSFLGPEWPVSSLSTVFQLLHSLKTLLRSMNVVCLVTCPTELLPEQLTAMLRQTADIVMKCSTMDVEAISDFTGRLELLKPPRFHSLHSLDLDTLSYGLKLQGSGITVEKLHLPPAPEMAPNPANLAF